MVPRLLGRSRAPYAEAEPVQNKEDATTDAAVIAAQLRALIPCSTDPTRLEKLAREIEDRAHQH
jgi:hypothetical protein